MGVKGLNILFLVKLKDLKPIAVHVTVNLTSKDTRWNIYFIERKTIWHPVGDDAEREVHFKLYFPIAFKVTLQLEFFIPIFFWQIAASSVLDNLVYLIGCCSGTRGSCV